MTKMKRLGYYTVCHVSYCTWAFNPNLSNIAPLRAQRLLPLSSAGTFATGILMKKETTRLLIQSHNSRWYAQ